VHGYMLASGMAGSDNPGSKQEATAMCADRINEGGTRAL
jgi:hypothetical protein